MGQVEGCGAHCHSRQVLLSKLHRILEFGCSSSLMQRLWPHQVSGGAFESTALPGLPLPSKHYGCAEVMSVSRISSNIVGNLIQVAGCVTNSTTQATPQAPGFSRVPVGKLSGYQEALPRVSTWPCVKASAQPATPAPTTTRSQTCATVRATIALEKQQSTRPSTQESFVRAKYTTATKGPR